VSRIIRLQAGLATAGQQLLSRTGRVVIPSRDVADRLVSNRNERRKQKEVCYEVS
jgi:hypothetical protein